MKHYIDEYFAKQGIKVIYNTLGHTDELVNAYIKESFDLYKMANVKKSNAIKSSIYNTFYALSPRIKKTGFEHLKNKDDYFRRMVVPTTLNDMWNMPQYEYDVNNNDGQSYKEVLKESIKKIENPLLFYSGGIDSELLLTAFLDVGIKPTIVMFELLDSQDNIINSYDLNYAYEFCKTNSLVPIVKRINTETLWDNTDFINLGKELRIGSPQILTHLWMIKIVEEEYKNYTYCFAGEVRYEEFSPYMKPMAKSVLVGSAKGWVPTIDTEVYSIQIDVGTSGQFGMYSNYDSGLVRGTYEVYTLTGSPISTAGSTTGYWTNTARPPDWNYKFWIDYSNFIQPSAAFSVNELYGFQTWYDPVANNGTVFNQTLWYLYYNGAGAPEDICLCDFEWRIRNATQSEATYISSTCTYVININP